MHRRRRVANSKQQPQHQNRTGQCVNDQESEEGKDLLDTKSYTDHQEYDSTALKKLSRHYPLARHAPFLIAFTRAEWSSVPGGLFLRFLERREESNILCLHTSIVFCAWLPREQTERERK